MRVLIRADASPAMGIGHVMRCLALTQALRDGGDEVTLVTAVDLGPLGALLEAEGAATRQINVVIGSATDARKTGEVARELGVAWVVLDGYAFDEAYRRAMRRRTRLAVIDDAGAPDIQADLVVNGNIYANEGLYGNSHARLLVGPRYALLRRAFREPPKRIETADIVLSLGGSDPDGRTAPLLQALAARELRGVVVIGPHQAMSDAIRVMAASHGWQVLESSTSMEAVLSRAAVAVIGAGTTALECARLGVPMVAVRIADNQARVATALHESGLAEVGDGTDLEGVAAATAGLIGDSPRLKRMAHRGPRLVDGRGAIRVAGEMRDALLALRTATRDDADRLLGWRNDPETRASSFDGKAVTREGHLAWLQATLANSDRALLIATLDADAPVGVLRLDRQGRTATISVTVAPEARGHGLSVPLIRAGLRTAGVLGCDLVDAFIRPENLPSLRAFSSAGFSRAPRKAADGYPASTVRMTAAPQPRP